MSSDLSLKSIGWKLLQGLLALLKVSIAPIVALLFVALILVVSESFGSDERSTLLFAALLMLTVTTMNAMGFWRSGQRRTAIVGGVIWIGCSLLYLLALVAFWDG